ncbi:hypothetical protein [Alkaliphilus transvaalensis]|uniref:hypothetical protein n=1 Tax=Alkaliphilus transvaalensis TaxID=114628 RepID=UPI00047BF81F|nr:hypothetical protein [Alkaliphilus transvaalensis]
MKKNKKVLFSLLILCGTLIVGQLVYAAGKEPGSTDDPLVTVSFVEQKINQIKAYVDDQIRTAPSTGGATTLEVVNVGAGQTLVAGQGTEMILRSGRATAVASPGGGLSDVTAGRDITTGEVIPQNHLLIIPRADGRGAKAETATIFMVRGSYRIE